MIYFIREGFEGNIKIGYTTENIYKRKSALQNGNSRRLVIIGTMNGNEGFEKINSGEFSGIDKWTMNGNEGFESYLKNKFQHCQLVGEWFTPKKELLDFIDKNVQFHLDYVSFLRELIEKTKDKMKQSVKVKGLNNVGKWNVVESGGYYRAFRNIGGKNVGIYIGKEFNPENAIAKIKAKGFEIN